MSNEAVVDIDIDPCVNVFYSKRIDNFTRVSKRVKFASVEDSRKKRIEEDASSEPQPGTNKPRVHPKLSQESGVPGLNRSFLSHSFKLYKFISEWNLRMQISDAEVMVGLGDRNVIRISVNNNPNDRVNVFIV